MDVFVYMKRMAMMRGVISFYPIHYRYLGKCGIQLMNALMALINRPGDEAEVCIYPSIWCFYFFSIYRVILMNLSRASVKSEVISTLNDSYTIVIDDTSEFEVASTSAAVPPPIAMNGNTTQPLKCKKNYLDVLKDNMLQIIILGSCGCIYIALLFCLYKQRINEIYLFHVSYIIILTLLAIDVSFSFNKQVKWVLRYIIQHIITYVHISTASTSSLSSSTLEVVCSLEFYYM